MQTTGSLILVTEVHLLEKQHTKNKCYAINANLHNIA